MKSFLSFKAFTLTLLLALVWLANIVFAATTSFEVTVEPNPFKVSEFVDVTIKSMNIDGNVDTTFVWDVWISVQWFDATDPDVVIPGWGIGFFEAEDLWIKIFSKGLSIKKAWTYILEVTDLFDESITGTVEIKVTAENSWPPVWTLDITEPSAWATLTTDAIDVVGTTTYPNTPLTLMIDGQKVADGLSDQQWAFIIPVSWIIPWSHTLQINALDLNDQIVASSDVVPFILAIDTSTLMTWIEVTPGKEVIIWETVTFTIRTADRVDAVLLTLWDGTPQPTTKQSDWIFTKQMLMDTLGTFSIDVTTMIWAEPTFFEDAETVTVKDEVRKVIDLTYKVDDSNSRVTAQWNNVWTIEFYKVRYGTSRSNLRLSLTTNKKEGIIVLADPTIPYYAQVFPVDVNGETNGLPSQIVEIGPLKQVQPVCGNELLEEWEQCDDGNTTNQDGCSSICVLEPKRPVCGNRAPEEWEQCDDGNLLNWDGCDSTCEIEIPDSVEPVISEPEQHSTAPTQSSCNTGNIPLETMQINGQYYISWKPIDKAISYIVYRADKSVSSLSAMNVVSRTTSTRFEYPFDPNSEMDQYAWYAVEAICENNDQRQIGNITAVKVGPEHTVLFILGLLVAGVMTARVVKS